MSPELLWSGLMISGSRGRQVLEAIIPLKMVEASRRDCEEGGRRRRLR